jgi:hypothetical protein
VRTRIVECSADDSRVSEHVTAVPGTYERPMTRAQVEAKCSGILQPILGSQRTAALVRAVWTLETLDSVRALRPFLVA